MDEVQLPYVIAGEWVDDIWMKAAAARNVDGPDREKNEDTYARGPRTHPYGVKAYTEIVENQPRIYPTKEAADADLVEQEHADDHEPDLNNVKRP